MVKKKKSSMIMVLIVALIITGLGVGVYFGVGQAGFTAEDAFYVNTYTTLECDLADGNYILTELENIRDGTSPTLTCGKDMNGYTNYCDFEIKGPSSLLCSVTPQKCDEQGCVNIDYLGGGDRYDRVHSIHLDPNRDGFISESEKDIYKTFKLKIGSFCGDDVDIRVKGNAYILKEDSPTGYRNEYEQGCNLNYVTSELHPTERITMNYQEGEQVPFGRSISYIYGVQEVISANVITQDGQKYYIERPGYKIPIKTAIDGAKYAVNQDSIEDSLIECLPANIFNCNADATIKEDVGTDITGDPCSVLRGVDTTKYYRISQDQTCKFSCVNNAVQSDCVEVASNDCGQGEVYDAENNRCISVTDTSTGPTNIPGGLAWYWWALIVFGGIVIIGMLFTPSAPGPTIVMTSGGPTVQ